MTALLAAAPSHLLIAGGLLAVLVLSFIAVFLLPGLMHWQRLMRIRSRLVRLDKNSAPGEIGQLFAKDKRLAHLWDEYQDSLHLQKNDRDPQRSPTIARSTLPAETFFNGQYVVDSRLRTEFFKHLPGLFTGIGIIGTFTGLIEGLHKFQISEDTSAVRGSLESLMHSVGQAFLVSAAAITAAMLVTFVEKLLLASLYRCTESIAQDIDALFDAGAGEEYLSRLVSASEDSAQQSKLLKNALVAEIGDLLRDLAGKQLDVAREQHGQLLQHHSASAQRQIDAAREDSVQLAKSIGASIESSLREPMLQIAASVKSASGDQSANAARMLEEVMGGFSRRLSELFGGQVAGLSQLNQQTAEAMQEAVRTLQSVGTQLSSAGRESGDALSGSMTSALREIASQQSLAQQQTQALLEQLRQTASLSQNETRDALQSSLDAVGKQVGEMLSSLGDTLGAAQAKAAAGQLSREEALAERHTTVVSAMSETVEQAIKHMGLASVQMAKSVAALTQVTTSSLDKMNTAAALVSTGATGFATAGDRVSGVLDRAATVAGQLVELSGALTTSAGAMEEGLNDYRVQREGVGQLVGEMRATVELARKEVGLTADVLGRIEGSTERLGQAQHQADQYLSGVTRVLADAHQAFADATRKTLDRANTEFHAKLATSVGLLSSTIVELEASLGNAVPRTH